MTGTIWDWRDDLERERKRDIIDRLRLDIEKALTEAEYECCLDKSISFNGLSFDEVQRIVKKIAAKKHAKKVSYDRYEYNNITIYIGNDKLMISK